jgi:hypothetical protein
MEIMYPLKCFLLYAACPWRFQDITLSQLGFIDSTASRFRGLIKVRIANFHRHHRYQRARCGSVQAVSGEFGQDKG